MSTGLFFIGGMLGRIASPIVQDWFKYKTNLGREIAQREKEEKVRAAQLDLENKLKINAQTHRDKLVELEKQYQDARKRAEEQMYISREDWQQKLFWEKCFPLRNPYELPLGYEPRFDESKERIEGCRLKTVMLPNNRNIVPLRVITALKDSAHSTSTSLNNELSMFIVNYFEANGVHAVISDIGSWKEDAPINDASINFLYTGAKGQPTLVIVPFYTNNGSTIRIKVWSWGLGEDLIYPKGYDFAWLDLEAIKRQAIYTEIKKFAALLDKTGITLPPEAKKLDIAIRKLQIIENQKEKVSTEEFNQLLSLVDFPDEVKLNVDKTVNNIVASVFACLVGMQADNHHLSAFGTLPQLPLVIDSLSPIPFMYDAITSFYSSIINGARIEGIISDEDAINSQLLLCEAIERKSPGHPCIQELINNVRVLNNDTYGKLHVDTVARLRSFTQTQKKLQQ